MNSSNININISRNWCLYLLENDVNKKTYLGVSTNIERRLRQHNNEIKGGAKYTTNNLSNGKWILKVLVENFTKSEALSYERILKNKRRVGRGKTPLERRMFLLRHIFCF